MAVYVSGAVARPGVYWLRPGAIAQDLVEAAGGLATDADDNQVNLARRLEDGEHIHVPRRGEPAQGSPTGTGQPQVDINRAMSEELDALPGIGPQLAARIVAYREANGPFSTVEELQNVEGIGEKTLEHLRPYVVVR